MAITRKNGDVVSFFRQKDYVMVDNDLGGGSFGKTVLLKDPYIDELFVAKKYEPVYDEIRELFYANFLDEIKILYKLNHPNIVRIFNYCPFEDQYTGYIIMEFIPGTDIGTYLHEYEEIDSVLWDNISPNEIFIQLIDAFCYIEQHGIIHRDIREGNILIQDKSTVKVIDFGIGKFFDPSHTEDSLVSDINRENVVTLPQEYYEGEYTSLTDMFYLADLLYRLMKNSAHPDEMNFSYQSILEKMMEKEPKNRFKSFSEIKEAIGKHDFVNLEISEDDKRIYQDFSGLIYSSLNEYTSEPKFNRSPDTFIERLESALRNNAFEYYIQSNADIISSVVNAGYKYSNRIDIPCETVRIFLDWFKTSTDKSKELILSNIIYKLSTIRYEEPDGELPF